MQTSGHSNCSVFDRTAKSLNWRVDISHRAFRVYNIQMCLLYEWKKIVTAHTNFTFYSQSEMQIHRRDFIVLAPGAEAPWFQLQYGKLAPTPDFLDSFISNTTPIFVASTRSILSGILYVRFGEAFMHPWLCWNIALVLIYASLSLIY